MVSGHRRGTRRQGAQLEPYAGMLAHSVVRKKDGTVFEHLHPGGNISMAAQQLFMEERTRVGAEPAPRRNSVPVRPFVRLPDGSAVESLSSATTQAGAPTTAGPVITIPYAFPTAGEYRMWVQVNGRVGY